MRKALLKLEREAVRLPVKDREVLAERLMRSVTREPLTQVEEAGWRRPNVGLPLGGAGRERGCRLSGRSNRFARISAAV